MRTLGEVNPVVKAQDDIRNEIQHKKHLRPEDIEPTSCPTTVALLLALKQKKRMDKNEPFIGFLLQNDPHSPEYENFLLELKDVIDEIPVGTRISLAVLTTYYDHEFDKGLEDRSGYAHWTAIDLMIGEDHQLFSFVLDAALSVGYRREHAMLKELFPEGKHFIFRPKLNDKLLSLQHTTTDCSIFTLDHIKQLTQIDGSTLYLNELPHLSDTEGVVSSYERFGDLNLTRILRGIQSLKTFQTFPENIKNTVIKKRSNETLLESIHNKTQMIKKSDGETEINQTIFLKNKHYTETKAAYFSTLDDESLSLIMEHCTGFIFLKHPVLFSLLRELAQIDKEQFLENVSSLCDSLEVLAKNQEIVYSMYDRQDLRNTATQLAELKSNITDSLGHLKQQCLFKITNLFEKLEEQEKIVLIIGESLMSDFKLDKEQSIKFSP